MNLRKLAQGKPCMIRSPLCNYDPETTVLAHWRDSSTGIGAKESDLLGSWACKECHDLVDGRNKNHPYEYEQVRLWHLEGIIRTIRACAKDNIIKW